MPQLTAREVFDRVSNHMLTQNQRASHASSCMYRTPNGLKCAVGCLIPDEDYSDRFEGITYQLAIRAARPALAANLRAVVESQIGKGHTDLLTNLQYIHDKYEPCNWPAKLQELLATIE